MSINLSRITEVLYKNNYNNNKMQHFQPQENLMKNKLINDVGMEIVGYVTPDKTKIKR